MKNLIAAIDLGTTKVVATVGEKTNRGVKIVAYSEVPSRGVVRGRIENPKLASQCITEALKKIEDEHGLSIKKAYVGICGQDIACINPEAFKVTRADQDECITPQEIQEITKGMFDYTLEDGYKVIHAIPQSFNVDNYMSTTEPVGMMGKNIMSRYKLLIGKENSRILLRNTLKLANVEMLGCVVEPIASANAVLSEDEMGSGVAVVDIGGGTTDVVVIQNNIVRYAGIIPFGGFSITSDISAGCKISIKQAEALKKRYGSCFSDYAEANKSVYFKGMGGNKDVEIQIKVMARIIQARMEEILEAVNWHIEESGFKKTLIGGIVFTGGGAEIAHLVNLANFITGMEARISKPAAHTVDGDSVKQAKECNASTAVGTVIYGFNHIKEQEIEITDSVEQYRYEEPALAKTEEEPELATVEVANIQQQANAPKKRRIGSKIKDSIKGFFDSDLFNSQDADDA